MCRQESIRTAFLLSQGGEFAFVLLSLANELKVLPTDLNRLLIIVVVLSMALTPFLAEAGKRFAESTVEEEGDGETPDSPCCMHGAPTFAVRHGALLILMQMLRCTLPTLYVVLLVSAVCSLCVLSVVSAGDF